MAFWWSNCIQLRWMLWAMCHGGGADNDYDELDDPDSPSGEDTFDWVMKVQGPALLLSRMWWRTPCAMSCLRGPLLQLDD